MKLPKNHDKRLARRDQYIDYLLKRLSAVPDVLTYDEWVADNFEEPVFEVGEKVRIPNYSPYCGYPVAYRCWSRRMRKYWYAFEEVGDNIFYADELQKVEQLKV